MNSKLSFFFCHSQHVVSTSRSMMAGPSLAIVDIYCARPSLRGKHSNACHFHVEFQMEMSSMYLEYIGLDQKWGPS